MIYIAYDESDEMKSSLVKLRRDTGIAVDEVARSETAVVVETSTHQNTINPIPQVEEDISAEKDNVQVTETPEKKRSNTSEAVVSKEMTVGKTNKEVNLVSKDEREVRLDSQPSLVIDPLTFAAEYLKDMPS